jgi:xylulokinase
VLPHFAGSGTPFMDPESRGAMLGLSLATAKRDIALGILEGVAQEMAMNLDALRRAGVPVRRLYAGGGGARSPGLVQLRADVFNTTITPLDAEEAGCLACAMLAACALNPSIGIGDLARSWIRTGEPVQPRPDRAAVYAQRRKTYGRLYPMLRQLLTNPLS